VKNMGPSLRWLLLVGLFILAACSSAPMQRVPAPVSEAQPSVAATDAITTPADIATPEPGLLRGKSRWVPVAWSELPGFEGDALFEAWNAWLKSCERPGPVFAYLCPEVRRLSIGGDAAQRQWLLDRLQPYRVEPLQGGLTPGLLTAYFEPEFEARRTPGGGFVVPLYMPPVGLNAGKPWFSRKDIETLPQAQAALRGREIVYLADPVQALVIQIQGSGRVRVTEPDGGKRLVRLAYAAHNGQPYQSIGRWLLDQGELRDASWPGIRGWMLQNPQRVTELLWRNPRVVFFKEETLGDFDAGFGPRGAQGVPLTPGRSIAVDPESIPYGTPVWLSSEGANLVLNRLVLAQDTGSAIVGPLRADYFVGWGDEAGELAGRFKQALRLWVLWPKQPR
jgi:membrane-bound lytic murein transglycosylase A